MPYEYQAMGYEGCSIASLEARQFRGTQSKYHPLAQSQLCEILFILIGRTDDPMIRLLSFLCSFVFPFNQCVENFLASMLSLLQFFLELLRSHFVPRAP